MVNECVLVGNVGADPEVRSSKEGLAIANIRLATESWGGKERGKETDWHRVVAFGKAAEIVARYVKKGKQLYVRGRIKYSKYADKDGNEKYSTEIIASDIRLLGKGDGGQTSAEPSHTEGPDPDLPF